jgi:hypothetical protein
VSNFLCVRCLVSLNTEQARGLTFRTLIVSKRRGRFACVVSDVEGPWFGDDAVS